MRNRNNPAFEEAVLADPHLQLTEHERMQYCNDINRPMRRILLPIFRFILVIGIHIVRFIKRILPIRIKSHTLLSKMGVWFMRDLISPEALEYIIRHFQYESALINFIADNCGSENIERVTLFPSHVSQLGDVDGVNAIVLHDINIYNFIIDSGSHPDINIKEKVNLTDLDFSALTLPPINFDVERKRWLNLDIETSSYIMLFFLVLFLSDEEAERAALSLQFDESLLTSLANMTGDNFFRFLCPMKYTHSLRYHFDVVQDLRYHMMSIDFAFNRLSQLKTTQKTLSKKSSEAGASKRTKEACI